MSEYVVSIVTGPIHEQTSDYLEHDHSDNGDHDSYLPSNRGL